MPKRRSRRRVVTLAEPHEALDTLVTVQLRVLVFPAQTAHAWCMMLLVLVHIVIAWLVLVLTTVYTAAVVVWLYISLFRCSGALGGGRLEHGRVLDKCLGNAVPGVVRGSVVLILRIGIVVRHCMGRVGLLRTLRG